MTKLIIQIPCFNESETLAQTLACLPRTVDGVDEVEFLVIDDGSSDDTSGVALRMGVHHLVRHRRNRGLAAAFRSGIAAALEAGADIIVNTDGDGQYEGADIGLLVQPIVSGQADIVIGDRGVGHNSHFSPLKRLLQRVGSNVVQRLASISIPDAVSGFRAISRSAAQKIHITTEFSYTTDMLIQAGQKRMAVVSVPIRTHNVSRPSRLFSSIPHFIAQTAMTILRTYTTYKPLRVFGATGFLLVCLGVLPFFRFLWFWLNGNGDGHLQSLVFGVALLVVGVLITFMGVIADLIGTNRKLLETLHLRLSQIEEGQAGPRAPAAREPDGVRKNFKRRIPG